VGRQWLVEFERGKPRASLALVLRTVEALGIRAAHRREGAEVKNSAEFASRQDDDSQARTTQRWAAQERWWTIWVG